MVYDIDWYLLIIWLSDYVCYKMCSKWLIIDDVYTLSIDWECDIIVTWCTLLWLWDMNNMEPIYIYELSCLYYVLSVKYVLTLRFFLWLYYLTLCFVYVLDLGSRSSGDVCVPVVGEALLWSWHGVGIISIMCIQSLSSYF